jgi:DNA-directed RNA polymerase subunit RPC12/RpoP
MGNKSVCFNCKKSFSFFNAEAQKVCPECKGEVFVYPHRFRTPKKDDIKKWAVVEYLKENDFFYQHISKEYEYIDANGIVRICSGYVKIPETMREAKEFVEGYSKPVTDIQKANSI